jgi:chromosome segregation ATPase
VRSAVDLLAIQLQKTSEGSSDASDSALALADLKDEMCRMRAIIEPRLAGLQEELISLNNNRQTAAVPAADELNELAAVRQWLQDCQQRKSEITKELKELEDLYAASKDRVSQQQISFQTQMSQYEQLFEVMRQMRSEQHQLEHDIACKKDSLHDLSMQLAVRGRVSSAAVNSVNGPEDEENLNERIKNLLGEIEQLESRKKSLRIVAVRSSSFSAKSIGM